MSLRGGHFQCPTRQSETRRNGIPERGTAKPARCRLATNQNFGITSLCAPVLRHGMPYLWLKDCHVAALLAMTRIGAFFSKRMFCAICGHFFAWYCFASCFKRFVSKIVPFSRKTYRFCHCEEGIFKARRGNLKRDETASRNELRGREGKRPLAASR